MDSSHEYLVLGSKNSSHLDMRGSKIYMEESSGLDLRGSKIHREKRERDSSFLDDNANT